MKPQLNLYGAFLHLEGQHCVVVGGGSIATRKVLKLREADAHIRIISPTLQGELARLVERGEIEHWCRGYQNGDLVGAILAFACTNARDINRQVAEEARQRGIFVNVADDSLACTLVVPATVTVDPVQIAIGTMGTSPALARELRALLEGDIRDGTNNFILRLREGVPS